MSDYPNLLTRRNFLRFTTGLGIAVAFEQLVPVYAQLSGTQSGDQADADIIDLVIQETPVTIGAKNAKALTINGSIPGQLIRLQEGQTAKIRVTNKLKEDTSIHWHGIILPPSMDGVPGLSFVGIKPEQTFTYEFPVAQSGTYWYHSHSGIDISRNLQVNRSQGFKAI